MRLAWLVLQYCGVVWPVYTDAEWLKTGTAVGRAYPGTGDSYAGT